VAFSRNHLANKVHRPISLYLKACGTAAKAFDTMSALGVTLSQKWALTAVEKLAKSKMDDLVNRVKNTSFHTTHDNINRMFRVSHQRVGHNSHFDSGTAATVFIPPDETDYKLPETNEEFLKKAAEGATTPITPHEIQELHADAAPRIFAQNVHTAQVSVTFFPWVMEYTMVTKLHGSWAIRHRTPCRTTHDPWG
jgi:hypothetical protein